MTLTDRAIVGSRWSRLISKFRNERFRHAYFEKSLKAFLANQIRALRGDLSQTAFGKKLGMTQSVVSRLEDENYGKLNTETLIEIAKKLNVGLVIKFVDFPTFLRMTDDMSAIALQPRPFGESDLKELENINGEPPLTSTIRIETDAVGDSKEPQAGAGNRGDRDGAAIVSIQ